MHAGARYKLVCAASRSVGRMRTRQMLAPACSNALYMIDGCHNDRMVVRSRFHARTLHILIMANLFFATYDKLILLTKAWKMHDAIIKVVAHILIEIIEVASNSS